MSNTKTYRCKGCSKIIPLRPPLPFEGHAEWDELKRDYIYRCTPCYTKRKAVIKKYGKEKYQ